MSEHAQKKVHVFGKIQAVRYGDEDGNWEDDAPDRIAKFVLGHDINSRVTTLNEGLMRVIEPVEEFWDPKQNLADIVVTDTKSSIRHGLALGQWLARYPSGTFRPLPHNVMVASFFPPPPSETFEVELRKLIVKHKRHEGSGSPDHVVTDYVLASLGALNTAIRKRDAALTPAEA